VFKGIPSSYRVYIQTDSANPPSQIEIMYLFTFVTPATLIIIILEASVKSFNENGKSENKRETFHEILTAISIQVTVASSSHYVITNDHVMYNKIPSKDLSSSCVVLTKIPFIYYI